MSRDDLIQALPGAHNYMQADGVYNSSKAVVGLPPRTASQPSIPTGQRSFKRILQTVLTERKLEQQRLSQREINDMLIINPNLNLKAVQIAHPNAELVKEEGVMRLHIPEAPQVDTQAFQQNAGAVQQLVKQQRTQNAPESHPLTAISADPEIGIDAPFGRVIAPGQLSALLMGHGIPAATDIVTPQSVNALMQRSEKLVPIEEADLASMLENAYSHWDKLAWDA